MELHYSSKVKDEGKSVKAMGRDIHVSFKHAVVICDSLRGMNLRDAIDLLEGVVNLDKSIPFRKFNKGIGHRKGLDKDSISKYPKKAASHILKILKNLENNAEYKGLDKDKLVIRHIQAQKGIARRKRKPRGRWTVWKRQLVSVQVIAEET